MIGNESVAPAQTALAYVWNELTEGWGTLIPTNVKDRPTPDTSSLDAAANLFD
jgi:hypothetical protein